MEGHIFKCIESVSNTEILLFVHHPRELFQRLLLHGVLGSPFSGRTIVSSLIRLQKLSNVGNKRIFGVGISQEGANGKQDFADGQCRTPLILQNVQTDTTVRVDVAVINACGEMDLRRLSSFKMDMVRQRTQTTFDIPDYRNQRTLNG